jgi:hypothetical protein
LYGDSHLREAPFPAVSHNFPRFPAVSLQWPATAFDLPRAFAIISAFHLVSGVNP